MPIYHPRKRQVVYNNVCISNNPPQLMTLNSKHIDYNLVRLTQNLIHNPSHTAPIYTNQPTNPPINQPNTPATAQYHTHTHTHHQRASPHTLLEVPSNPPLSERAVYNILLSYPPIPSPAVCISLSRTLYAYPPLPQTHPPKFPFLLQQYVHTYIHPTTRVYLSRLFTWCLRRPQSSMFA